MKAIRSGYMHTEPPKTLNGRSRGVSVRSTVNHRIISPTLGTSEVLAAAHLNVLSLSGEQRHEIRLTHIEPCALSPLGEGTSRE